MLPLIEEKQFEDLTVVTSEDIAPYFREYTDAKVIVPSVCPTLVTQKTKRSLISNAVKSRIEYKRMFSNIKNEEIYAFSTSWSVVYFSYIKRLSKNNKVYFYLSDENYDVDFDKDNFRFKKRRGGVAFAMRLFARVFLGVNVFILDKGTPAWEIVRHSFSMEIVNYNPSKKPADKYTDMPHSIAESLKGKDVLFLSQDVVSEGAGRQDIIELTNGVKKILDSRFDGRYAVKAHPRDKVLYGEMQKSRDTISPYLLAETLGGHNWKIVIGYYSAPLSSHIFKGAKVISLVHLWKWTKPDIKHYWMNRLEDAGVFMPENMKEFEKMLG